MLMSVIRIPNFVARIQTFSQASISSLQLGFPTELNWHIQDLNHGLQSQTPIDNRHAFEIKLHTIVYGGH